MRALRGGTKRLPGRQVLSSRIYLKSLKLQWIENSLFALSLLSFVVKTSTTHIFSITVCVKIVLFTF